MTSVDVNEDNKQGVGLYQRMGFKIVGCAEVDTRGMSYPILQMELGGK